MKSKPMTRQEWKEILRRGDEVYCPTCAAADRIEATIENGGFAPEPITQDKIKDWIYGDSPGANEGDALNRCDLHQLLDRARSMGFTFALRMPEEDSDWHIEFFTEDEAAGDYQDADARLDSIVIRAARFLYRYAHPDQEVTFA